MGTSFSQVVREAIAFPDAIACIPEEETQTRAIAAPWHALAFISEQLDAETLRRCALSRPDAAIRWAWALLPDDLARECVRRAPWDALYYAAEHLDDLALESCIFQEPLAALAYANKRLTNHMRMQCRLAFHSACVSRKIPGTLPVKRRKKKQ